MAAKIPSISLSRYYSNLRGRPKDNWNALALQEIERSSNQTIQQLNTLSNALIPGAKALSAKAGGASALPATPAGYTTVQIDGEEVLLPYYKKV